MKKNKIVSLILAAIIALGAATTTAVVSFAADDAAPVASEVKVDDKQEDPKTEEKKDEKTEEKKEEEKKEEEKKEEQTDIFVVYEANNEKYTAKIDKAKAEKGEATLAAALTLEGYEFTGWNTKADGTGTAYTAGQKITGLEKDLTLYAQWKVKENKKDEPQAKKYKLSYEGFVVDLSKETVELEKDAEIKLLDGKKYEGTSYVFLGWFEDDNYKKEFKTEKMPEKNITVYGKYAVKASAFKELKLDDLTEIEDYDKELQEILDSFGGMLKINLTVGKQTKELKSLKTFNEDVYELAIKNDYQSVNEVSFGVIGQSVGMGLFIYNDVKTENNVPTQKGDDTPTAKKDDPTKKADETTDPTDPTNPTNPTTEKKADDTTSTTKEADTTKMIKVNDVPNTGSAMGGVIAALVAAMGASVGVVTSLKKKKED